MLLAGQSLTYMRTSDYERFIATGNSAAASARGWQTAKSFFTTVDNRYGRVQAFSLQGFEVSHRNLASSGTIELVHLAGVLVRDKQSTDFTFVLVPTATLQDNYLYGFSFSEQENQ